MYGNFHHHTKSCWQALLWITLMEVNLGHVLTESLLELHTIGNSSLETGGELREGCQRLQVTTAAAKLPHHCWSRGSFTHPVCGPVWRQAWERCSSSTVLSEALYLCSHAVASGCKLIPATLSNQSTSQDRKHKEEWKLLHCSPPHRLQRPYVSSVISEDPIIKPMLAAEDAGKAIMLLSSLNYTR